MQINKVERQDRTLTFTVSTDTEEYEAPLVLRHVIGDEGYAKVSGPNITDEESREVDDLLDSHLRSSGLPGFPR